MKHSVTSWLNSVCLEKAIKFNELSRNSLQHTGKKIRSTLKMRTKHFCSPTVWFSSTHSTTTQMSTPKTVWPSLNSWSSASREPQNTQKVNWKRFTIGSARISSRLTRRILNGYLAGWHLSLLSIRRNHWRRIMIFRWCSEVKCSWSMAVEVSPMPASSTSQVMRNTWYGALNRCPSSQVSQCQSNRRHHKSHCLHSQAK